MANVDINIVTNFVESNEFTTGSLFAQSLVSKNQSAIGQAVYSFDSTVSGSNTAVQKSLVNIPLTINLQGGSAIRTVVTGQLFPVYRAS